MNKEQYEIIGYLWDGNGIVGKLVSGLVVGSYEQAEMLLKSSGANRYIFRLQKIK